MARTWLAFLLVAMTCALVQANGYYWVSSNQAVYPQLGLFPQLVGMPANVLAPADCKDKKEASDSSSSEGSSSESSSSESSEGGEEAEKESGSSSEEGKSEGEGSSSSSSEEEEKKGGEESSEEAETMTKVKTGSALFPPRSYTYSANPFQQVMYPSYGYYPSYRASYSLMQQPYPIRSYQYLPAPAASVVSSPAVSSKVVSAPVVYSAPTSNGFPVLSKGYSITPGANVVAAQSYWNPSGTRYAYYKR